MKSTETNNRAQSFWGLLALLLVLLPGLMFGQSAKMSHELNSLSGAESVDVIVQYHKVPTQTHFDRVHFRGGSLNRDLHHVKAGAFRVPAARLAELSNDPDVKFISLDRPVRATSTSSTPDLYAQAVLAQAAQGQYDGTGIGIAVIDSGITSNADFGTRVVYSQNFVVGQLSADDGYGHGTHIAGIAAGNGANSTGANFSKTFTGIASKANLINLRVLDQNGSATDSAVIAAIQTAIQLKSTYNIKVINLSLGRGVYESYTLDPLCQAVESAWKAGIVVVVAAGNDGRNNSAGTNGYGTVDAPGNDPYVITVGSMKPMSTPDRADDLIASYSSKGPSLVDHIVKPDLVAPGNQIISVLASTSATLYNSTDAVPTNYYNNNGTTAASTNYFSLNGTSMAAGVVSGTAALMLQQNPALTPDQLKARLMKTAYKTFPTFSTATDPSTGLTYTSQYDIFTVGAGYLDIQAALQDNVLAPNTVGAALSPSVAIDASGNFYLSTGSSTAWGNSVAWGTSVVWGTSVLWGTSTNGTSVLWGTSVAWGTSTSQGYSVLWGSSSNSGTSVLWGSSTGSSKGTSVQVLGE